MNIVDWEDRLSVGVASIDRQHMTLIDLTNELYRQVRAGAEPIATATFADLYNYILNHFEAERRLMERHGYPDVRHHEAEHHAFVKTVDELHARSKLQGSASNEGLVVFLVDWVVDHICNTDMQLGAYIKARAGGDE